MHFISIDLPAIDKNNSSKNKHAIVIILIGSLALIVYIICCIHECCRRRRRRRHRDFTPIETQQDASILGRFYPQLQEASAPQGFHDLRDRWENIQHTSPSNNNTRVATIRPRVIASTEDFYDTMQSRVITPIDNFGAIPSINDEPPAYSGMRFIFIIS